MGFLSTWRSNAELAARVERDHVRAITRFGATLEATVPLKLAYACVVPTLLFEVLGTALTAMRFGIVVVEREVDLIVP